MQSCWQSSRASRFMAMLPRLLHALTLSCSSCMQSHSVRVCTIQSFVDKLRKIDAELLVVQQGVPLHGQALPAAPCLVSVLLLPA